MLNHERENEVFNAVAFTYHVEDFLVLSAEYSAQAGLKS